MIVHRATRWWDLWICSPMAFGERGTDRDDLVTCPWCLARVSRSNGMSMEPVKLW